MTLKTYGYAYRSDTREAKSRYHINEDALITLPSGEIVAISNQWGIVNIELLIEFVRQNGFVVEKAEQ